MLSARTILGLFAAGLVGTIAEPCAWAEVRVGETAVATAWPYLPSVVEARGASDLSASLLPPSSHTLSQSPGAARTVSASEAAWLASLKLPDLPVRIDARVVEYLRFYRDSERGRAIARQWAERRGRFVPAVQAELKRASLPLDLVWLSMVESAHDPSIRSPAGALGLWQFMPGTARLYGLEVDRWIDERHDPELSTVAAVRFLSDLFDRFGSWELAMAAYNMGPGGLNRAIQKYNTNDYWLLSRYEAGVPWETTLYVPKVIATALVMNNQRAFGLGDVVPAASEARDTIALEPGRTLTEVAQATRLPLAELLRLNPQLVARRAPPPSRGWQVHLPPGKGAELSARLAPRAPGAVTAAAVDVTVESTAPGEVGAALDAAAAAPSGVEGTAAEASPAEAGAGRVIVVPARRFHYTTRRAAFYEVVDDASLAALAAKFHVTETELLLWNDLDRRARLQQGQVLQLFVAETQSLAGIRHLTSAEVRVIEAGSAEFYAHFEGQAGRVRLVIAAQRGDTLTRIGARYGIRPGAMERINQRSRRALLEPGEPVVVYVKPWRARQAANVVVRSPAPALTPPSGASPPSSEPVQAAIQPAPPSGTFSAGGTR